MARSLKSRRPTTDPMGGRRTRVRHDLGPGPARSLAGPIVACVALCLAWSLVTPLVASYDEPAHLYAAAAVVRGSSTPRWSS